MIESSLPLLQNVAYDEEVQKYEAKINNHFQEEEREIQKIHAI